MLNHAQSSSSHRKSTVFLISKHDQSHINPRFLDRNTPLLAGSTPVLRLLLVAYPFFISSIHCVRLWNRLFCGHWCCFGCLRKTPCLGIERETGLILHAKKNKSSSHLLDWIITLLAYQKYPQQTVPSQGSRSFVWAER